MSAISRPAPAARSAGVVATSILPPNSPQCARLSTPGRLVGPAAAAYSRRRVVRRAAASALGEQEFLEAIRFKPWADGHGYGFAEYAGRHGDFAIAGGAALLEAGRDGHHACSTVVIRRRSGAEAPVRGGTHADRPACRQSRHQTRRCRSQRARCDGRRPCDRRLSTSSAGVLIRRG